MEAEKAALSRARAQILRRVAEMPAEVNWAVSGSELPRGQSVPPPWVAGAIKESCAPLVALREEIARTTRADMPQLLLRTLGAQAAMMSILSNPPSEVAGYEKEDAEFSELRKAAVREVEKQLTPNLSSQVRTLRQIHEKAKVADAKELQNNLALFADGAGEFVDRKGEMRKWGTKTGQLCLAMWFHWPTLKFCANAGEVHAALDGFTGRPFSLKLVEKKCSEFGLFTGKRGRPAKKFLNTRRLP